MAAHDLAVLRACAHAPADSPRGWLYRGLLLGHRGHYEEALPYLLTATAALGYVGAEGGHGVYWAVQCFLGTQRYAEGIEFVERAREANPDEPRFGFYQQWLNAHAARR